MNTWEYLGKGSPQFYFLMVAPCSLKDALNILRTHKKKKGNNSKKNHKLCEAMFSVLKSFLMTKNWEFYEIN